ncbi:ABC transporter substrate-binding protein [Azospirillum sp.]|uniref:ABC transporter substrate-binding protein n=1 Tax=Azospirillum sp. TaxID=34012 RepID=UPI002D584627|nr:ABC transporter substrate-binding protein [Azospirillum sp.]HYD65900.1 ABC transporter substrate-binding protein [Azospirillum sp.]
MRRLTAFVSALVLLLCAGGAAAQEWDEVLARARGQVVQFNAWGGSVKTNDYLQWAAETVKARYGVELKHVRLADTAEAVARVQADKAAGRTKDGAIDLLWINGKHFAGMKEKGLLYGPFTQRLPNQRLVDTAGKPTTVDFTVPVEGMEAPWSMARFVFVHDTVRLRKPPRSIQALLEWAREHPGRFTYPRPPNLLGSTFLKQALMALSSDWSSLVQPATAENFDLVTEPLWPYLDELHPLLWRGGAEFPFSGADERQLLKDGQIDISMAFSLLEAASAMEAGLLPKTARVFGLDGGTIGSVNFLAIPFNARAREGALVVINFLLSPEAQARKADPRYWGADTVLDMAKLRPDDRRLFEAIPVHPAAPAPGALGPALPEPHPSWMELIEKEWLRRYANG